MPEREIHSSVLQGLFQFVDKTYNSSVTDYILQIFGFERKTLIGVSCSQDMLSKILHYIQKMSTDKLISFHAGFFFGEHRVFSETGLSGARLFARDAFSGISKIIARFFPGYAITSKQIGTFSCSVSIIQNQSIDEETGMDYYTAEFIRGLITALPLRFKQPQAKVKIESYPFSLSLLLSREDIIFRYDDPEYKLSDRVIAIDKKGVSATDPKGQIALDNFTVKNFTVVKDTTFEAEGLLIEVRWQNEGIRRKTAAILLSILGAGVIISFSYFFSLPVFTAIGIFCFFEAVLFTAFSFDKLSRTTALFRKIEHEHTRELIEQQQTAGVAVDTAYSRLSAIENLMQISKALIYEKDIRVLVDSIRRLTAKAMNADRATVFIHDKKTNELSAGPALSEEAREIRIPDDRGIAGQIMRFQSIVNVADAYNNPHFNREIDKKTGFHTKTILGAPLLDLDKNLVGVIQVLNKKGGQFEKIDENILETLATYIAIALGNSLAITNLQEKGIEPEVITGLSVITEAIAEKFSQIKKVIDGSDHPNAEAARPLANDIETILETISFIFAQEYSVEKELISLSFLISLIQGYAAKQIGERNIAFSCESTFPGDTEINCDTSLFARACNALIDNAVEAIESEGEITISCYRYVDVPRHIIHELSLEELEADYNRFQENQYPDFVSFIKAHKPLLEPALNQIKEASTEYLACEVYDNGALIALETREKIFSPFFSTKTHFGLGLSTAKAAISRMQGKLDPPIKKKTGKYFCLRIPIE